MAYTLNQKHLGIRRADLEQSKITVNEFIKEIKTLFGAVEYKATSKEGKVFKTKGYDEAIKKIARK